MFKKKKMLYKDKKYFLLFLSITSDISLLTFAIFFIFMLIWCEIDPGVAEGIGFYWILGMPLSLFVGIPSKLIDITNIKYSKNENKLKEHGLIYLHFLLSVPTVLYWLFVLFLFVSSLFGIK